MAYVPAGASAPGTTITVDVRGRLRRGEIVPKPIYKREE
jgi:glycine cleavage system aminomethyltransferase T